MRTEAIEAPLITPAAIPFVDPQTLEPLEKRGDTMCHGDTGDVVATIVGGVPRFVDRDANYAETFGFQWNNWHSTLSDERSADTAKRDEVLRRTHFLEYDIEDKTILECGMGGGDDTEILLSLPFREIHSFDLSTSVERASRYLDDPRLTISQASITEIPYPDAAFDVVFCHRVLQHTPDPEASLRSVCRKVKPGGLLFAHVYKLGWLYAMNYKYKYRWLTKRLPHRWVHGYVERCGGFLHRVNKVLWNCGVVGKVLAYNFVPFNWHAEYGDMNEEQLVELAKLNTFDALAPAFDRPMTSRHFRRTIESEGFRIEHYHDPPFSPLFATAVKD
jgi:ubiquinone/menaquinone biosynthesis C-methylase UbiE